MKQSTATQVQSDQTGLNNSLLENFGNESILEILPSAVYVCDADGLISSFNNKAVELWGRRPENGETEERFCGSFRLYSIDGQLLPHDQTPIAQSLRDGIARKDVEVVIERPDLSRITVCVSIAPILNKDGEVIGVINSFNDITERKDLERRARENELSVIQMVQGLNAAIYTTDAEGRITLFNTAAAELWGREPMIGQDQWCGSFEIVNADGDKIDLNECPMAICLREQRSVYGEEIIIVRPDGSLRNVAPYPRPFFDENGVMTGAVNLLVDITEDRIRERALKESEKKYRELAEALEERVLEKMADLQKNNAELQKSEERYHKMVDEVEDYAIILLSNDGIIQNWNRGAEKIKGYKEEEIIGKSFSNFYLPADRESGLPERLLNEASTTGKAIHEGWRMRKDGSRFWGSIVLTALHNNDNEIIGFSKVTRDLTAKKLAEDNERQYTSQLEFQNKELEQFAYAASHDLKEPLRKIHFYNSAVIDNRSNILDDKSKEYLKRSAQAVMRMSQLIEDLLTYSQTTTDAKRFESVVLNAVLSDIKYHHNDEIEAEKLKIDSDDLPVIQAIPFQIHQLFANIISNSLKYKHPDRPVHIKVSHEVVSGRTIDHHEADRLTKYHKFDFYDNGLGFESQYSEKIFDIFQRLHNSPSVKGSGIGLALCKRIVQNHNGFIKAWGEENNGADIQVFLPVR